MPQLRFLYYSQRQKKLTTTITFCYINNIKTIIGMERLTIYIRKSDVRSVERITITALDSHKSCKAIVQCHISIMCVVSVGCDTDYASTSHASQIR